jgi:hypothetical protein
MDSEEQFDRLARRDSEVTALASRGRRRALAIMVLLYIPSPFVVMKMNKDASLASLIPIALACLGGISYSWAKWTRRPEDAQSIAFVGLDRRRRSETYRSMWRGHGIKDPVVLTIVESIDRHLRQSVWAVVVAVVAVAAMTILLIETGDPHASGIVASIVIAVVAAGAIAGHRAVMSRVHVVLARSLSS